MLLLTGSSNMMRMNRSIVMLLVLVLVMILLVLSMMRMVMVIWLLLGILIKIRLRMPSLMMTSVIAHRGRICSIASALMRTSRTVSRMRLLLPILVLRVMAIYVMV